VDARKPAVCRCNVGFLKISPAKHVDVCVDSDEDRGSTPLASTFSPLAKKCHAAKRSQGGRLFATFSIHRCVIFSQGRKIKLHIRRPLML